MIFRFNPAIRGNSSAYADLEACSAVFAKGGRFLAKGFFQSFNCGSACLYPQLLSGFLEYGQTAFHHSIIGCQA